MTTATPNVELPPAARGISPYTGWTRTHWETLADAMLTAVRPFASQSHALVSLPGPASTSGRWSDALEGFARTFLLAGFRLAQSGEADPHGLAEWYAQGLTAGTDPTSGQRWPTLHERQQAKVEAASIALALHESRPFIWDRLSDPVRQRVVAWLHDMLGASTPDNNWVWFKAVVNAFLRSVGGPWSPDDIDHAIARTEDWYAGEGWYSDGPGKNFDYYCGWAMHFYPLWYCRISGEDALSERYRERLTCYLHDAQHLVGRDGAPLIQGRSLTYRWAMLAPFWGGAVFDAAPWPPGRTRRLASGVVRQFLDADSVDTHGLLPLGWHAAFPAIRQSYSGPGSPYWAAKGFAGLVLPAQHPVWTDTEEPLPIDEGDVETTLHAPGWIVSGTHADGIVRIVNHGTDHEPVPDASTDDPLYARHGYATHAAPHLGEASQLSPLDSHVVLLDSGGRPSHRGPLRPLRVDGRSAISRHEASWPHPSAVEGSGQGTRGPLVTTASVLRGPFEVRLACVDPVPYPDSAHAGWRLRMGGWSLAAAQAPSISRTEEGTCVSRHDGLRSTILTIRGFTETGAERCTHVNPLGTYAAVPWVATGKPLAPGDVYAALVVLSGSVGSLCLPDGLTVDVTGARVRISWPDGDHDIVDLASTA